MSNQDAIAARPLGQDNRILHPATLEEELAWITQYDDVAGELADWICASRHKAVYGEWPDGRKPDLPRTHGLDGNTSKWLMSQAGPEKWFKARNDAVKHGWAHVLRVPYPIRVRTSKPTPAKSLMPVEAFPGQLAWLRQHTLRELRMDAAVREPRIRLQLYDVRTERERIKAWFEPNLCLVDDAEWKAQFLRLKELGEQIRQLEADLQLVERLLNGNNAEKSVQKRRIASRDLSAIDRAAMRRRRNVLKKCASASGIELGEIRPIITESIAEGCDSLIDVLQFEIPDERQVWHQSVIHFRSERLRKRKESATYTDDADTERGAV
ncbi:MAG: hypothetical protein V4719_19090 [Planctomycetota bacterium]